MARKTTVRNYLELPEFWACHYYYDFEDEPETSETLVKAIFGLSVEQVTGFYVRRLVRHHSNAFKPAVTLALAESYTIALDFVDRDRNGHQIHYYLEHPDWPQRLHLGYQGRDCALPVFRWAELAILCRVLEPLRAARATLLLYPAVWLSPTDARDEVAAQLNSACRQLGIIHPERVADFVAAVLNRPVPEVHWHSDPQLGWINDGERSFRNPDSSRTRFSPADFERLKAFFAAIAS